MSGLGQELEGPPSDGVTALRFSAVSDLLLASSWDGAARLYSSSRNDLKATYSQGAPLLDACFQDDSVVFTAGLDRTVRRYDFFARAATVLGSHDKPVRCVEYLPDRGLVATAGWDNTLRLWDARQPQGRNAVALLALPGKAFTLAHSATRLVVGTSGRHVIIYDLRSLESGRPEQQRESSLKYQTRCIRCFPDGTGYALSSVEGRVAMEFFDLSPEVQARKYAFKCHRQSIAGKDTVFPINAIAFHPVYGTFATGGCDGAINVWDGQNQKRLHQISKYPTSVAALAFSHDGSSLAVASSYTHEMGAREHPADAIFVRRMADSEVKPKPRKQMDIS